MTGSYPSTANDFPKIITLTLKIRDHVISKLEEERYRSVCSHHEVVEEEERIESNRKRLHKPADKLVRHKPDPDTPVYDGGDCDAYVDGKNREDDLGLIDSPLMVVCYSFHQSHNTSMSNLQNDALLKPPDFLPGIHFDSTTGHSIGKSLLEWVSVVSEIQAGVCDHDGNWSSPADLQIHIDTM